MVQFLAFGAVLAGGITLVLWLAVGWFVPTFFGTAYDDATRIVRILLIAAFMLAIQRMLNDCFRGMGFPGIGSIGELSSWTTLIITLPIGTWQWGLTGVAWAIVAASAVSLVSAVALYWRRLKASDLECGAETVPRQSDVSIRERAHLKLESREPKVSA
jgi:O-antigen/teichoic acid export membrane protein